MGDDGLRQILDGKCVLLYLLCQRKNNDDAAVDDADAKTSLSDDVKRPCIAFRVAGSPGNVIAELFFDVIELKLEWFLNK